MIQGCSHLVIVAKDVAKMSGFFKSVFEVQPHYENPEFVDFVLPSKFRIAFFKATGTAAKYFHVPAERTGVSYGITVSQIDTFYKRLTDEFLSKPNCELQVSGPPKEHPWGEKSFLLIDPEQNRWEITQSPSQNGMLVNRK